MNNFIQKSLHCNILFGRSNLQGPKLACIVWHVFGNNFHKWFFYICCKRLAGKAWASFSTSSVTFFQNLKMLNKYIWMKIEVFKWSLEKYLRVRSVVIVWPRIETTTLKMIMNFMIWTNWWFACSIANTVLVKPR